MEGKTCDRCGYELTGLDVQGRCPECGGYYDSWSGEGIGGGPMESVKRGDWVVRLFQAICLAFLAVVMVGLGVLFNWKSGETLPLIFMGAIGAIFLASSISIGISLKRK
jgi:hypothetical protein